MDSMAGLDPTNQRQKNPHDGVDVTGVAVRERNISMVYQQVHQLTRNLTVYEISASTLRLARWMKKSGSSRYEETAGKWLRIDPVL